MVVPKGVARRSGQSCKLAAGGQEGPGVGFTERRARDSTFSCLARTVASERAAPASARASRTTSRSSCACAQRTVPEAAAAELSRRCAAPRYASRGTPVTCAPCPLAYMRRSIPEAI